MAQFECDRCGKCCGSFGAFITIERQLNDRDYYCRYGITNELFLAQTQPEYADEISDKFSEMTGQEKTARGKTCPFVCKNQDGNGFTCAIYSTRPLVCREFRCYRMLIFNREGHLCGRVIGYNDIRTSDDVLTKLWKEKVAHLPHAHPSCANDPAWVTTVTGILEKNGYRGDPVE